MHPVKCSNVYNFSKVTSALKTEGMFNSLQKLFVLHERIGMQKHLKIFFNPYMVRSTGVLSLCRLELPNLDLWPYKRTLSFSVEFVFKLCIILGTNIVLLCQVFVLNL